MARSSTVEDSNKGLVQAGFDIRLRAELGCRADDHTLRDSQPWVLPPVGKVEPTTVSAHDFCPERAPKRGRQSIVEKPTYWPFHACLLLDRDVLFMAGTFLKIAQSQSISVAIVMDWEQSLMATEIERKFLVVGDAWRSVATHREHLRDGLIATTADRKVRVRIYEEDERATITIKARNGGITNAEFEYDIPMTDAEELLASHCGEYVLGKCRYFVPHRGFLWHVDVYEGILDGVILAEVEVAKEDAAVPIPPWVGQEVTGRSEYKKREMLRARLAPAVHG
jgi:CYTH domain-containing protein